MLNRRPLYSAFASARRFASWHLRAQTELIFAAVQHHISDSSAPRTAPRSSQGSVCVCLPACVVCRCTRIAAAGSQCLQEYPCCDQPAPPGAFQGGGMSPPLHCPQEFPRWSVCVHSWSVPALPGVSQGSAACLRTAQPPGVPKVACACAFLFRASAPGSIPRWRSMSPHPESMCVRVLIFIQVHSFN